MNSLMFAEDELASRKRIFVLFNLYQDLKNPVLVRTGLVDSDMISSSDLAIKVLSVSSSGKMILARIPLYSGVLMLIVNK